MDMEELVTCNICMETFDENVRPRSLPCGHTFCTDCINNGIEGGLLLCALCKKQHQASNGNDFPINYTAKTLVSRLQAACLGAIPLRDRMSDIQPGGSRGVSKKMQALIQDQKDQLKSLLKISNETKTDITEYKSYIQDRRGKHTELREKIHILQQNNEEMIFQLEKEDKRVTEILKEVEEHQNEAKKKLRNVYTVTNATYIVTASDELERVQDDLELWNEKCKMQLPCNETIRRSQKVIRKTTEALNLYEKDEEDEVPLDFNNLLESDLSVMKKIEILEERTQLLGDIEGLDCCSICMGMFDMALRPRTLPCGHTFCTSCIQKAIEDKNLVCAHCKVSHHASNATNLPINYSTESIVSKIREIYLGEPTKSNHTHDTWLYKSRGLSSQMYSVICEQKDNLKSLIEVSNVAEKDVLSYKAFIHDRNEVHKNLSTKTNVIIRDNEEMFSQLEKEENRVTAFMKDGEACKKEAMNNLMKLDTITKDTNILTASEELEKVHDNLTSWNAKYQSQFPCSKTILQSEKVVKKTTEALNLYEDQEDDDASSDVDDLIQTDLSIMEKTKSLMERNKTSEKNVKMGNYNLITIHSVVIQILKSELPFAAQERDGVTRYAKMTSKENKIYLHCLQNIAPPEGSSIIPYDEVIEMANKDSMISFMDLSWEGSIKGRIHILLSPQTPLATHFYNLCTAQLGPSYLHTIFFKKYDYFPFRHVIGGDYERNDGSGGSPIFQGLDNDSDIYLHPIIAGSVGTVDYEKDGPKSAQFQINTDGPWKPLNGIFGQLQDGLNLVREAAELEDIKKVRIEDCGIVLPF